MITQEDIFKVSDTYFDSSCDVSFPGMTRTFKELMDLAKQLLKERDFEFESNIANMKKISDLIEERDAALEGKKAAELRAEAYREALEKIAKPALGGKMQQWVAREALRITKDCASTEKGGV